MQIKFREDWNGFKRGEVASLTKGLMVKLIRYGHAIEVKPEPKKKPTSRKKKVERAVKIEKD